MPQSSVEPKIDPTAAPEMPKGIEQPSGRRGFTIDAAVGLHQAISTSAELGIGLGMGYKLEFARRLHISEDVKRVAECGAAMADPNGAGGAASRGLA